MNCPNCKTPMTSEVGIVEYPVITGRGIGRRTKLCRFFSCSTCEHCEEAGDRG